MNLDNGVLSNSETYLLFQIYGRPKHRFSVHAMDHKTVIFSSPTNLDGLMEKHLVTLSYQEDYDLYYVLTERGILLAKMLGADEE